MWQIKRIASWTRREEESTKSLCIWTKSKYKRRSRKEEVFISYQRSLNVFREERIKRTQDIAENAAAEIRDSNEVVLLQNDSKPNRKNGVNFLWSTDSLHPS